MLTGEEAHAKLVAEHVFGRQFLFVDRYVEFLADEGLTWGLLGPREKDKLWSRHILNSVAMAGLLPAGARMIDVGSGAGLPGIPLALLRPDLEVTLLEPLLRRVNFLELVCRGLADLSCATRLATPSSAKVDRQSDIAIGAASNLIAPSQPSTGTPLQPQLRVVRGRAEDHRETYDVVTCRAVAATKQLIIWCAPLLERDGSIVALKGQTAQNELQNATRELKRHKLRAEVLSVRAHADADATQVVRLSPNIP